MEIRGVYPAMLTAWNKDETYDANTSERYIDWLIESGAEGLAVTGSTGEMSAMSINDQKEVIGHAVSYGKAKGIPVFASVGKYSTNESVELGHAAREAGADSVMVILPYYYKPYKDAARRHLRIIKDEVGLPISIYNNPNFAGYEFTPREIAELYSEGVITSIKAAQGDSNRIADLKALCDIPTFYGHDYAPLGAFAAGADGWLSGFPAAFPRACRAMQTAIRDEKDLEKGRAIWKKFYPFVEFFMDPETADNVHWLEILKFAVAYQGVEIGLARRPLIELDKGFQDKMIPLLDELLTIGTDDE